jgi:hypothetical protein
MRPLTLERSIDFNFRHRTGFLTHRTSRRTNGCEYESEANSVESFQNFSPLKRLKTARPRNVCAVCRMGVMNWKSHTSVTGPEVFPTSQRSEFWWSQILLKCGLIFTISGNMHRFRSVKIFTMFYSEILFEITRNKWHGKNKNVVYTEIHFSFEFISGRNISLSVALMETVRMDMCDSSHTKYVGCIHK